MRRYPQLMAPILRVKARWSGFVGSPGYTVLHFRDFGTGEGEGTDPTQQHAVDAVARTRTFFNAFSGSLPSVARVQVEGEVDLIESTTGELLNSFAVPAPAIVAGTASGVFAASTGAVVNWRTNGVRNGRRLRGRSFIVPLGGIAQSGTGTLNPSVRDQLQLAANALAASTASPDLVVYGRPSARGAADGQFSVVTSTQVPDLLAVLRSRRD